jgi:hypothetical protein
MRHVRPLIAIVLLGLVLTACFGSSSNGSESASSSASPPAQPSGTPVASSEGSGEPSAEPVPSDELGPFTCDLPIHVDQTVLRAQITDVRTGTHDGYDRVVFGFAGGLPEASLERAEPPFTQDASAAPIEVAGESFLRLIMRNGTKQTEEGTSSYDGPTDFETGYPVLVQLTEGGDFEAQSTWYLGLTAESCVRVLTLTDDGTARLVIDIEH